MQRLRQVWPSDDLLSSPASGGGTYRKKGRMALFCFQFQQEDGMTGKAEEIRDMLAPTVEALGLELLGVEYAPSVGNAMLRLYIDKEGGGVGIEDCESVSREVSALLDVNDPIASEYTLEVSSPGIDRPLFGAAQFARFLGEQAKLSLRVPQEGRRRLQGRIARVEGDRVVIAEDKAEYEVAEANIEKARLVPDLVALGLAPQPKPTGKPRRKPES